MLKRTFDEDLKMAVEFHGHLCAGQVLGTRLSRIALEYFGIQDPYDYKDLVAFVEADRCVADAVTSVANCHIGRRRLKWRDLGKMAATFYDCNSGQAIRIAGASTAKAAEGQDIVEFFNAIPDNELFKAQLVEVDINEYDLPGHPKKSVICEQCGEKVMDNRDVQKDGRTLCKTCAGEVSYYKVLGDWQI